MGSEVGTGPMPVVKSARVVSGDLPAPQRERAARNRSDWEPRYRRLVAAVDVTVVAVLSVVGGLINLLVFDVPALVAWGLTGVAPLLTLFCFAVWRAWEPRALGQGSEEFSRVFRGTVTSLVLLGLVGLGFELSSVRSWTFLFIPVIGIVVALGRYLLRRALHRRRTAGRCMHRVLAVGSPQSVAELVVRTRDNAHFGWEVAGACTADGRGFGDEPTIAGVPVVGDLEALRKVVEDGHYRVVAVTPAPDWSSKRLQTLSWEFENSPAEIVVDPGLMEVAGPRLHVKPVDGLPLLRLEEPRLSAIAHIMKGAFDRLSALLLLLLLLPVFVAVAAAVKLDGGPVFFRQTRVGKRGATFTMVKFRSMVVDAEKRRAELVGLNEGAGPLFKMRRDPRITRVGHLLRRYSLDELPQLFNVLGGSMSLVGPRPPLPAEVAGYSTEVHRRLHVRPGLTGLWQVSGRSNLSWEESVRLDLRYVENWSLALDALILWKTVGAVLKGDGAY
ncbi:MAG: Exopolysaccharide biosynthesis polyprenyl glycosylphosphotransferase [uncultured Pseudonocardia sp.]|uniref:Exopolysaccharide biosynthesis polyprenyl glycosylphosphotransferase n=1 Tax=uncultured Pseudonocardia sp. TaxID=211455 RepID=A0A6J4P4S7_9PSEU|nr:MAG: Exopolysaccharide biosynthesis polyprenyl glycosylphosphotransferase [uncultured Pseudonocardia sp.]